MMLKNEIRRLWWVWCVAIIAASYPVSAIAAEVVGINKLTPPFVVAWAGVWLFAIAGGFCASFIHVSDVDKKLKYPALSKVVIGTSWGMAVSLAIDAFSSTPMGAIMLFALVASCFSAPVCAGLMVYISDQKRQNGVYDLARDAATMRAFGRKSKRGDDNESS